MILTERRKKHWADEYNVEWMDGMPLTLEMIRTFYDDSELEAMLEDLVRKKYLVKEHPKRLINGRRIKDSSLPEGYNIVAGKISYQVNRVLDPAGYAPTLVAMDMERLYVSDGSGIRRMNHTVKDLWLKKVWEITKSMSTWPLTVQYKNNILHKIRPGNWFSERAGGKVFESMEDFLSAFEETIYQNVETRQSASQWKNKFLKSYRKHYGHDTDFPRWEDIRHKYGR